MVVLLRRKWEQSRLPLPFLKRGSAWKGNPTPQNVCFESSRMQEKEYQVCSYFVATERTKDRISNSLVENPVHRNPDFYQRHSGIQAQACLTWKLPLFHPKTLIRLGTNRGYQKWHGPFTLVTYSLTGAGKRHTFTEQLNHSAVWYGVLGLSPRWISG